MERLYAERIPNLIWLVRSPAMNRLKDNPRWRALLARMKLEP